MLTSWAREQQRAAQAEGWDIFASLRGTDHMFDLQRIDCPWENQELGYEDPKFQDDYGAWVWVLKRAGEGEELHLAALAFLEEQSPEEYREIDEWADQVALPEAGE